MYFRAIKILFDETLRYIVHNSITKGYEYNGCNAILVKE